MNCTTIDWFHPWPRDALQNVANSFLRDVPLADAVRPSVVEVCVAMQSLAQDLARRYMTQARRFCYVTPTSYLDLIKTFSTMFEKKRSDVWDSKTKYENGLTKLSETAVQVKDMQMELEALRPFLLQASVETGELMKVIEVQSADAAKTKAVVEVEEAQCNIQAAEAQKIKDTTQFELDSALPLLQEAMDSLKVVKKNDLVEVKAMKSPPPVVGVTMMGVCILMGIKPDRVGEVGKKVDDWWTPSTKQLLNDPGRLLQNLENYDKEHIAPDKIKALTPLVEREDFQAPAVAKQSQAVAPLCKWVHAMYKYDVVMKKVEPMRKALAEAEALLAGAMEVLAGKKAQLQSIMDQLQGLQDQFDAANKKKQDLEFKAEQCAQRLTRAESLLGGLSGEKDRWTMSAAQLEKDFANVCGNILISSGVIAYLGVFTAAFRSTALTEWLSLLAERQISCADNFVLERVIGNSVQVRTHLSRLVANCDTAFSFACACVCVVACVCRAIRSARGPCSSCPTTRSPSATPSS